MQLNLPDFININNVSMLLPVVWRDAQLRPYCHGNKRINFWKEWVVRAAACTSKDDYMTALYNRLDKECPGCFSSARWCVKEWAARGVRERVSSVLARFITSIMLCSLYLMKVNVGWTDKVNYVCWNRCTIYISVLQRKYAVNDQTYTFACGTKTNKKNPLVG